MCKTLLHTVWVKIFILENIPPASLGIHDIPTFMSNGQWWGCVTFKVCIYLVHKAAQKLDTCSSENSEFSVAKKPICCAHFLTIVILQHRDPNWLSTGTNMHDYNMDFLHSINNNFPPSS